MRWFKKQWAIRIICGHCGFRMREWNTGGLTGMLVPIGKIVTEATECPSCKRKAQWWINLTDTLTPWTH